MTQLAENLKAPLVELLLSVADDKLMLGHRNSDWTGLGPILEEDIAFSSLAQDEIAHAQILYELASEFDGRSTDVLAFGRDPTEFRCAEIVELPDDFDWAFALCRQFFCDHYDALRLGRMARSSYAPLAAIAARLAAEEQVHVDHADAWITRLGAGTEDSRKRVQAAIDRLAPVAPMLHEPFEGYDELESAGIYPRPETDMFEAWSAALHAVTDAAGLTLTLTAPPASDTGGRRGRHSEHLAPLLDEMCEVFRLEPTAAW